MRFVFDEHFGTLNWYWLWIWSITLFGQKFLWFACHLPFKNAGGCFFCFIWPWTLICTRHIITHDKTIWWRCGFFFCSNIGTGSIPPERKINIISNHLSSPVGSTSYQRWSHRKRHTGGICFGDMLEVLEVSKSSTDLQFSFAIVQVYLANGNSFEWQTTS